MYIYPFSKLLLSIKNIHTSGIFFLIDIIVSLICLNLSSIEYILLIEIYENIFLDTIILDVISTIFLYADLIFDFDLFNIKLNSLLFELFIILILSSNS